MKQILFNKQMEQAIIDGHKTVTRRKIKFTMKDGRNPNFSGYSLGEYCTDHIETGAVLYSRRGDMGWEVVTERVFPKYAINDIIYVNDINNHIYLKVTNVSSQRLQDMTIEDAIKEGIQWESGTAWTHYDNKRSNAYISLFSDLWDSTLDKEEFDKYCWVANPYVFVYDFVKLGKEATDIVNIMQGNNKNDL